MSEKRGKGRPSKLNETVKNVALNLYRIGKTDKHVAEIIGVCEKTINNYKKSDPEFFQSIKQAKADADDEVINALRERALGYTHPETVFRSVSVGDGMSQIEQFETTRHYPPDTKAIEFWLKNRKPEEWRDKQEIEVSGDISLAERLKKARERSE